MATWARAQSPPKSIFATYTASGRGSIRVSEAAGGKVHITLRVVFAGGHTCSLSKTGDWRGDHVQITAEGLDSSQPCELEASFPNGAVVIKDSGLHCAPVYCGTRGKLDGLTLPKRSR